MDPFLRVPRHLSMLILARVLIGLVLLFLVPLAAHALWWMWSDERAPSWSRANWSSAMLLPPAAEEPQAVVRIYAARTGRWRGIVAHHSWIVVKERGAANYTRYDKVGWGSPVRLNGWAADGRWFSSVPETIVAVDGKAAEGLIPRIKAAVEAYPHARSGDYRAWPGPNSNTFVAYVMAAAPELREALPPTALGKDWLEPGRFAAVTPSRTGLSLSLAGYAGITIGWIEGLELNLLGLVAGVDVRRPALKIPGWGRLGMSTLAMANPAAARGAPAGEER